uniref:Uncharacterized protein n=1 Tax=viral metagenome TaxID=1070528 RepID=A0A6C0DL07_9ZZZZ
MEQKSHFKYSGGIKNHLNKKKYFIYISIYIR